MGILEGKRILVTGVLMESSIAFHVARLAQQEGATVVLSSFGRVMRITEKIAGRLPQAAPVVELDVTSEEHLAALPDRLRDHVDGLDGVLHSIGFAPEAASADGSSTPSGRTSRQRCMSPPTRSSR
jgi:enoyl-[acyl-carrier protein] reductase I